MREPIKKLFNKLGFKHRDYEPPVKPRWKVETLGKGRYLYMYHQYKPVNCPDVGYYRYTGKSYNNGKFLEFEAVTMEGVLLFKGYFAKARPAHLPQAKKGIERWIYKY